MSRSLIDLSPEHLADMDRLAQDAARLSDADLLRVLSTVGHEALHRYPRFTGETLAALLGREVDAIHEMGLP